MKSVQVGSEEWTGDSDEVDQEEGQEVEHPLAEESRSPPRSSRKCKSEGGSYDSNKRQQQVEATTELIRLMHAKYMKDLKQKSEPSIYDKVAAKLEKLPQVTERGPAFMF